MSGGVWVVKSRFNFFVKRRFNFLLNHDLTFREVAGDLHMRATSLEKFAYRCRLGITAPSRALAPRC
jgi:hypothetical protein